jgi:hypothetical protein
MPLSKNGLASKILTSLFSKASFNMYYYQNYNTIIEVPSGAIIEGKLPKAKQKLVDAWIEIHRDELVANWELAVNGEPIFKIAPLK